MPESSTPPTGSGARAWLPTRKVLPAIAIAFGAGLLLFLALWIDKRDSNDFFRVVEAPRSVGGQVFTPLPVPQAGGEDGHVGTDTEAPPPAPAPAPAPVARPVPPVATPATTPGATPAAAADSAPRALSTPPPRYPTQARQRRMTGTVQLRVQVGVDGRPGDIEVVQGSGARLLDRAAVDGVRRWRFAPAMRNGRPVEGVVQVPIVFDLK